MRAVLGLTRREVCDDGLAGRGSEKAEVLHRLRVELPGVLAGRPVPVAYLYGSVAEGYAWSESDVNVALVLAPGHGLSAYQRLRMELDIAAALESRCGWDQVDVRKLAKGP